MQYLLVYLKIHTFISFLSDTFKPALVPFLVLKFDIDFLNFVITGFWPVNNDKSFSQDFNYFTIISI